MPAMAGMSPMPPGGPIPGFPNGVPNNGPMPMAMLQQQNIDLSPKLNDHELTSSTPEQAKSRNEDLAPLTDEQCMIATPWLRGMDMKTKEWGMFFIDELHDIVWNEKAFENLVLPEEDKALTWDFVEAKTLSNTAYDDFIADKGMHPVLSIALLTEQAAAPSSSCSARRASARRSPPKQVRTSAPSDAN
jgi:hypothetical protein